MADTTSREQFDAADTFVRSATGDAVAWQKWCGHLSQRATPMPPWELIPSKKSPLRWAWDATLYGEEAHDLIRLLDRWCRKPKTGVDAICEQLEVWSGQIPRDVLCERNAIACLAWSGILPQLATRIPRETWYRAWEQLCELAASFDAEGAVDKPLPWQLLAVELPLTLAYQFPELSRCRDLAGIAVERLGEEIDQLTDNDGYLRASHLEVMRPLLASWIRCGYLVRRHRPEGIESISWSALLLAALRLTRCDGTSVFSRDAFCKADMAMFDAGLLLADDPALFSVASRVLPGKKRASPSTDAIEWPADRSESADVVILRTDWRVSEPHFVITHAARRMCSELNCDGTTIWSGEFQPSLAINGELRQPESEWEENCWLSDDDLDYIELDQRFGGGWRIERQIVLARQDKFLFIGDAIIGEEQADIEYVSRLPLTTHAQFAPEKETREGSLIGHRQIGRVLPLALPEWRVSPANGELLVEEDTMVLKQSVNADRMYAPLWIDLQRKRRKRPVCWRQLTLAHHGSVQPPSVAVGYRAQIGDEHWLFYRSLVAAAHRSMLGITVPDEFMAGRLTSDGFADELIAINPC